MDLIIVTVSYNTRDLLADCLESAMAGLERSGLVGEVWVVDNASADGSPEMVRQRFPTARLVAHDKNLGFAAGNNLALRMMGFCAATSDRQQSAIEWPGTDPMYASQRPRHVLFLNPDTHVLDGALGEMVGFLDSRPRAGAAGPRLVHSDGSFQHSAFAFPGLAQILLDFFPLYHRLLDSQINGRYPLRLYEGGQPFVVDHPLGAALMVRAQTLAQVGIFDERFFMYCEEIDLCRRIKMAGWEIYCVPQATIVHLSGQSTRQFRDRMFVALWQSRFLMFEKHESAIFRWAARRLVKLGVWAETRRARLAHHHGQMNKPELESRLQAYQEVAAL